MGRSLRPARSDRPPPIAPPFDRSLRNRFGREDTTDTANTTLLELFGERYANQRCIANRGQSNTSLKAGYCRVPVGAAVSDQRKWCCPFCFTHKFSYLRDMVFRRAETYGVFVTHRGKRRTNLNHYGGNTDPTKARQFSGMGYSDYLVLLPAVRYRGHHLFVPSRLRMECRTLRSGYLRSRQRQEVDPDWCWCRCWRDTPLRDLYYLSRCPRCFRFGLAVADPGRVTPGRSRMPAVFFRNALSSRLKISARGGGAFEIQSLSE